MTEEWLRELLPECQDWQIECIVKQWQSDLEKTYRVTDSYEPVAMRYDYDGYGWLYIDNGSGSNWREKIKNAEALYTAPPQPKPEKEPVRYTPNGTAGREADVRPTGFFFQMPKQEPEAWQVKYRNDEGTPQIAWFPHPVHPKSPLAKRPYTEEPLYTAPPKREWVGLTEEERDHLEGLHLYAARNQVEAWIEGVPAFIDAIEAKLREKNG